jgi:hypothetical protein
MTASRTGENQRSYLYCFGRRPWGARGLRPRAQGWKAFPDWWGPIFGQVLGGRPGPSLPRPWTPPPAGRGKFWEMFWGCRGQIVGTVRPNLSGS